MAEPIREWFFISPIGEEGSEERKNSSFVEQHLLWPFLDQCHLPHDTIMRSDKLSTAEITPEMIRRLEENELCIADITGNNPNVFWELGYRQAIGRAYIVIRRADETETTFKLPFDIQDLRVIQYNSIDPADPNLARKMREPTVKLLGQYSVWKDNKFITKRYKERINLESLQDSIDSISKFTKQVSNAVSDHDRRIGSLENQKTDPKEIKQYSYLLDIQKPGNN